MHLCISMFYKNDRISIIQSFSWFCTLILFVFILLYLILLVSIIIYAMSYKFIDIKVINLIIPFWLVQYSFQWQFSFLKFRFLVRLYPDHNLLLFSLFSYIILKVLIFHLLLIAVSLRIFEPCFEDFLSFLLNLIIVVFAFICQFKEYGLIFVVIFLFISTRSIFLFNDCIFHSNL